MKKFMQKEIEEIKRFLYLDRIINSKENIVVWKYIRSNIEFIQNQRKFCTVNSKYV